MYIYIMYKRTNKKHGNHPPTRLTTHSPADPPTHPPSHPPNHPPMANGNGVHDSNIKER